MSYWDDKSAQNLIESEKIGLQGQKALQSVYEESYKKINQIISGYLQKYEENGVIPKQALNSFLTGSELANHNKQIEELQNVLKLASGNELYDKNFVTQIKRLEAIKREIYWTLTNNFIPEEMVHEKTYREVLQNVYRNTSKDIEEQTGFYSQFAIMDDRKVKAILLRDWQGDNWSGRLWKNNQMFAKQMPLIIGQQLLTGQSYQVTTRIVRERFNVRTYVAERLVRTETNYFHGQGGLESYIDEGIQKYVFSATLDGRTSNICRNLDGKVFLLREAKPGVNMHPMHPNCRSTTKVYLADEMSYKDLREEGGKDAMLPPVDAIEDLEERWGLPKLADSAQIGQGRGTYIAKINQGGDKALNAESEWIMKVWKSLSKSKQKYGLKRIDAIIKQMKDPGQKTQVEFLKKMLDI